jgi:hypothetical protein
VGMQAVICIVDGRVEAEEQWWLHHANDVRSRRLGHMACKLNR